MYSAILIYLPPYLGMYCASDKMYCTATPNVSSFDRIDSFFLFPFNLDLKFMLSSLSHLNKGVANLHPPHRRRHMTSFSSEGVIPCRSIAHAREMMQFSPNPPPIRSHRTFTPAKFRLAGRYALKSWPGDFLPNFTGRNCRILPKVSVSCPQRMISLGSRPHLTAVGNPEVQRMEQTADTAAVFPSHLTPCSHCDSCLTSEALT